VKPNVAMIIQCECMFELCYILWA